MEKLTLWAVQVIADCEGRSMKTIAKFSNEKAATCFASSDAAIDAYGNKGKVTPEMHEYYKQETDHPEYSTAKTKAKALSKLSEIERAALGV